MKKLLSLAILLTPSLALAQTNTITDVNSLSRKLIDIGNVVLYILVALAVIFIVWNVVMYLIRGGEPETQKTAKWNIVWGIIGLAIIISIWGLVNILTGTFRTTPTNQPIPNLGGNVQGGGIPANQIPVVQ